MTLQKRRVRRASPSQIGLLSDIDHRPIKRRRGEKRGGSPDMYVDNNLIAATWSDIDLYSQAS